ncbi:hypothetical protein NL676_005327 [Syzygium grande]|nr:hypothetical protein NL676_005327 [Syzygium grande]
MAATGLRGQYGCPVVCGGRFQKCVKANGLGLEAIGGKSIYEVAMSFPLDTVSKWRDPKSGELEGLSFDFNHYEAVATWEQVSLGLVN